MCECQLIFTQYVPLIGVCAIAVKMSHVISRATTGYRKYHQNLSVCSYLNVAAKQRENHGRVVIVTNEYNRLGTTLSMAYLIAQEGKTLKVTIDLKEITSDSFPSNSGSHFLGSLGHYAQSVPHTPTKMGIP